MTPSLVLDCSIVMPWCFASEATPLTQKVLDRMVVESAIVPVIWFLEVANVLAMAEKRNRISAIDSDKFLRLLDELLIESDEGCVTRSFTQLLPLSRSHQLTTYDAAYLELAQRLGLPLATLDNKLIAAARNAGVAVVEP